jgi:uncharacterized protein (TIGR00369 family)
MMTPRNPQWREYIASKIAHNYFSKYLGVEFVTIEPGLIGIELVMRDIHHQQNGYLHGGVTSAVCDTVAGFAAYTLVGAGQHVFTVESKVCYYNPGVAERFYAVGRVDKAGKRFHFCEAEMYYLKDGIKTVIAKSTTTMAVLEADALKSA